MLVLPGFVDTYRHTWQAGVRMTGTDTALTSWFELVIGRFAAKFTPEDVAAVLARAEELDRDKANAQRHEDELLRDLATLRRGAGMDTTATRQARAAPLRLLWHPPDRGRPFPADERLAVTVALGIAPGAQHVLLSDRVGVLADQLRVSERAARRRIDQSLAWPARSKPGRNAATMCLIRGPAGRSGD